MRQQVTHYANQCRSKKELRMSWRLTHPRDSYLHMEPLLRTLTREKDTLRTRKIVPGEDVESIWDQVMGEHVQFRVFNVQKDTITSRTTEELGDSPYMFYSKANVVEDEILFPVRLLRTRRASLSERLEMVLVASRLPVFRAVSDSSKKAGPWLVRVNVPPPPLKKRWTAMKVAFGPFQRYGRLLSDSFFRRLVRWSSASFSVALALTLSARLSCWPID